MPAASAGRRHPHQAAHRQRPEQPAGLTFGARVDLRPGASPSSSLYLFKGLGAYFSTYLMTDVGQRVVRDLRNLLFRHILGQSAGFFSRRTSGQLMSRHHQRRAADPAGGLGDASAICCAKALSLVGFACLLFYYDYRLALVCRDRRAAGRLPAGAPRPAGPADEPTQSGRARAAVAHHRRGLHRPSHRQGVRRGGARSGAVQAARPSACTAPT